jgi:hypothetical protein
MTKPHFISLVSVHGAIQGLAAK